MEHQHFELHYVEVDKFNYTKLNKNFKNFRKTDFEYKI